MKDLTEAELIEMETRASRLAEALDVDTEEMRIGQLIARFETAFYRAESVAADVEILCQQLRARAQKKAA